MSRIFFERFGRLLFDWFRTPIMQVRINLADNTIDKIKPVAVNRLSDGQRTAFLAALQEHTKRRWADQKARSTLRYSLAVLHNPKEAMPPTTAKSLQKLAKVGAKMGIEIELPS